MKPYLFALALVTAFCAGVQLDRHYLAPRATIADIETELQQRMNQDLSQAQADRRVKLVVAGERGPGQWGGGIEYTNGDMQNFTATLVEGRIVYALGNFFKNKQWKATATAAAEVRAM